MLVRLLQFFPIPDPDALDDVQLLDLVHDLHPAHDVPEHRELRVEVRLRECVMKNWLPPVSGPDSAIPTVPRR